MKTFKKGILALGLTLGIVASIGSSAFASMYTYATVAGYSATGHSYCYISYGTAYTSYNRTGYLSVSSVYNYVNKRTLATGTKTNSQSRNSGSSVSLSLYSPTNCRSVNMYSTHVVSANGKSWTGNTDHKYYA